MHIIVNGENKNFPEQSTLQAIIDELKIEEKVMAAAVNMEIVKKDQWNSYKVKEDDKLELLQFVGGGWYNKMSTKQKGQDAEDKACSYLKTKGFLIVEQNFYAKKLGEIDIICKKDDIYHFVEVKSSTDYESAINNITQSKISKLKRSIDYYLQTKKLDVAFCIDVIIVVDDEIEHLLNITIWNFIAFWNKYAIIILCFYT